MIKNKLKLGVLLLAGSLAFTSCDKDEDPVVVPTTPSTTLQSKTFNYSFASTYVGNHASTLNAELLLEEQSDGKTKITVVLNNTVSGETYMAHAHDKDSTQTNGYNPSPNSAVFVQAITGNGGRAEAMQITDKSFAELTTTYSAFLVVHDPLVAVNTADPSTYVILGDFARTQTATLKSKTFNYGFAASYVGTHANTLTSELKLEEQANGKTLITVTLNNTMSGQTYMTHAHDKDTSQTNGYNPSPNSAVFVQAIAGNGGTVMASQTSDKSYSELASVYEGFLVVHDPLVAVNTADPSTYVILGAFAR